MFSDLVGRNLVQHVYRVLLSLTLAGSSSHMYSDQYPAEYSGGTLCRSLEQGFSLSLSLSLSLSVEFSLYGTEACVQIMGIPTAVVILAFQLWFFNSESVRLAWFISCLFPVLKGSLSLLPGVQCLVNQSFMYFLFF